MAIDWKLPASEVSFQGVPKWQAENIEQLARKARENAKKQFTAFGQITPIEREKIDKEIEKLISHRARHVPEAKYLVSVTGRSKPIPFTEEDLKKAVSDKNFARKIYNATTSAFSNADVVDFQNRIREEYYSVAGRSKKTQTKFPVDEIFEKKLGIDNNFDNKKFRKDSFSSSDNDDDNQGGGQLLNKIRSKGNIKNKQIANDLENYDLDHSFGEGEEQQIQKAIDNSLKTYNEQNENRKNKNLKYIENPQTYADKVNNDIININNELNQILPKKKALEKQISYLQKLPSNHELKPYDVEKFGLDRNVLKEFSNVPSLLNYLTPQKNEYERNTNFLNGKLQNYEKFLKEENVNPKPTETNVVETEGQRNKNLQEAAKKAIEFGTQTEDMPLTNEEEIFNLEKSEISREQLLEKELKAAEEALNYERNLRLEQEENIKNYASQIEQTGIFDDESEGNKTNRSNISRKSLDNDDLLKKTIKKHPDQAENIIKHTDQQEELALDNLALQEENIKKQANFIIDQANKQKEDISKRLADRKLNKSFKTDRSNLSAKKVSEIQNANQFEDYPIIPKLPLRNTREHYSLKPMISNEFIKKQQDLSRNKPSKYEQDIEKKREEAKAKLAEFDQLNQSANKAPEQNVGNANQSKNFTDLDPIKLQLENKLKLAKAEASIVEEAFKADPTNQELSAKYDLANKKIKNLEAQLNSDKLLGGTNPQEPLPDLNSIKQNMASMKAFNEKAEAQGFPADTTTNQIVKSRLEYNQKRATEAYDFMKKKQEAEQAQEREQAPQVMVNAANKKEFVLPEFKTMNPSVAPIPLGQARLEASKIKRRALGLEETNDIDPEFSIQQMATSGNISWATKAKQRASQYADYLDAKKKEELSNNIPKIEQNENQQNPQQNNQLNEEILENIPEDFEEYAENYDQNNSNIPNQQNIPNIPNVPKNPPFGLLYHAGLENKLKTLNKESARLAPNNEIHEQVRRMAERNLDDDTLNLAKKEIENSKNSNISREVKPFIDQTQDPLAFMDQYRNRYQKNVIDALRDEAKESFLEDELPAVNNQFVMNGGFYSGAREAAIERAKRDRERHLHREIAKLMSQNEENAAQKSFQHKKHLLTAAEISANAAKAQQEAGIRNSEAYRVNAAQKQISNQANIDNMQKIADSERTHQQNVINAQIADYEAEKNYDWDQLQKESEVVRGLPSPGKVGYQGVNQGQPMPVNPYNTAIAALGMIGAPKAPGQFAKGGHVKVNDKSKNLQTKINKSKFLYNKIFNKFASGGSVNNSMKRWKEIQQHVEEQPEDQYMRRIANQFENHQIDPRQSLANQIIASHLGNLTGSPSENAGKAWAAHNATMERDVDRKLESKERAANLYGKIKDSRINQGKVLGEFYGQEETRAQSDRHHGETLGESRRQFDVGQTNRNEDFGESRRQFEVGQTNRKEELAEQARQRKIAEAYTQKEHEQKAKEFQANIAKRAGEIYKDVYPIASKIGYKSEETLSMITNGLLKGQNPYLLFKQENDTPKKTKQQAALEELKRRGDI